jgi:3-mercaptopyruvate sulfurtransferase SseA
MSMPAISLPIRSPLALLAAGLLAFAGQARAEVVSAEAAEQQLQIGAQAWDLRGGTGPVLPGAAAIDARALLQLLQEGDVPALSRAVSAAGLDLSRDVLIYGETGDARAQALHEALGQLATGRVFWLVGGLAEWQLSGRATAGAAVTRLPVPQRLVARDGAAVSRMAAASLRDTAISAGEQLAAAR